MSFDEGKDYLRCPFCSTIHFPAENQDGVRISAEPGKLRCPVCSVPLVIASLSGARVESCPGCRGFVISEDDLYPAIEEQRARRQASVVKPMPIDPRDLERRIHCPRCSQTMDTHAYGGPGNIVIDNCPACELNWLDHSEFRRAVLAPDWRETAES